MNLITGRTHQARVHAKYIGHPILFDKKYGDKKINRKYKNLREKRLLLHASSIKFIHPNKNKLIDITAPLDCFFKRIITFLKNKKI